MSQLLLLLLTIFLISHGGCNGKSNDVAADVSEFGVYLGSYDRRRDITNWDAFRPSPSSCSEGIFELQDIFTDYALASPGRNRQTWAIVEALQELINNENVDQFWVHYGLAIVLEKSTVNTEEYSFNDVERAYDSFCNLAQQTVDNSKKEIGLLVCRHYADLLFRHGYLSSQVDWLQKAVNLLQDMTKSFPSSHDDLFRDLGNLLRKTASIDNARHIFQMLLKENPKDGFASASLGWIYVDVDNKYGAGVDLLLAGVQSNQPGTQESEFYSKLSYALSRVGRADEARRINVEAAKKGILQSEWQRPTHVIVNLTAKPVWTIDEIGERVANGLKRIEENWQAIRDEALLADSSSSFPLEVERLHDAGKWQQMKLFSQGVKLHDNCKKTPKTCRLVETNMPESTMLRKGDVKFSLLQPGSHVATHCAATNFRLRAHLGLVVPPLTAMRLVNETITWTEGKFTIIDDSFEHEVWHNGTQPRLIFIIDFWHPDMTDFQKKHMQYSKPRV